MKGKDAEKNDKLQHNCYIGKSIFLFFIISSIISIIISSVIILLSFLMFINILAQ